MRRIVTGMGVALALIAGVLLATPGAAAAASPRCRSFATFFLAPLPGQTRQLYIPVENNSTNNWRCAMSRGGSQGVEAVRQLQQTLNTCYYRRLNVLDTLLAEDGGFGSLTRGALIKVQNYHRISADGIYGPQTASTIYHETLIFYDGGGHGFTCLNVRQAGLLG